MTQEAFFPHLSCISISKKHTGFIAIWLSGNTVIIETGMYPDAGMVECAIFGVSDLDCYPPLVRPAIIIKHCYSIVSATNKISLAASLGFLRGISLFAVQGDLCQCSLSSDPVESRLYVV